MGSRGQHWLIGAVVAVAVAVALAFGGSRPPVVQGAEPTPTPLNGSNGHPGGSGGGGGGT